MATYRPYFSLLCMYVSFSYLIELVEPDHREKLYLHFNKDLPSSYHMPLFQHLSSSHSVPQHRKIILTFLFYQQLISEHIYGVKCNVCTAHMYALYKSQTKIMSMLVTLNTDRFFVRKISKILSSSNLNYTMHYHEL